VIVGDITTTDFDAFAPDSGCMMKTFGGVMAAIIFRAPETLPPWLFIGIVECPEVFRVVKYLDELRKWFERVCGGKQRRGTNGCVHSCQDGLLVHFRGFRGSHNPIVIVGSHCYCCRANAVFLMVIDF